MSKLGLALASLVAAIPGVILTVLLVMTFLNNADNLSGMMWAISVPTLLTSVLVAVIPVGVMLFGPKAETSDDDEANEVGDKDKSLADDAADDDLGEDEDLVADAGDELSMEDDDDASETIDAGSEDLFMEDDDDFGLELDDDEDKDDK